jgi:hypothetical protein
VNEREARESGLLTERMDYRAVERIGRPRVAFGRQYGRGAIEPNGAPACIQPITPTYDHVRLRSGISSSHAATAAAVSP